MKRPRRWRDSHELEQELALLRIERVERRNEVARRVNLHVRLGVPSAEDLRELLPPGVLGRVD